MKYKEFEGPAEELILLKMKEIEEKEHIKVLHVVESGSRAWGFASPDSDYDVRFIYVRDKDFYLSLRDTKDFIDWELNEVLDINGWDLKKALQHFHKSNATLFEWSNSPVVYYTTDEWKNLYGQAARKFFACKPTLYHYYGTANKNYHEYLTDDMVKYKKYFYVLRPILACKWIEEKKCPPPVLFDELFHSVLEDHMKAAVRDLLAKKRRMSEADKAPRIEKINQYIEEKLVYYKALVESMEDDRNPDWEPLEREFRKLADRN
ncbi:MAG: nucleotidyltransferase domain-containing protein [Acetatifactor sp.]|nr:nucleotidyltransferase domain-containing protein [Acetatifactor sp.]